MSALTGLIFRQGSNERINWESWAAWKGDLQRGAVVLEVDFDNGGVGHEVSKRLNNSKVTLSNT